MRFGFGKERYTVKCFVLFFKINDNILKISLLSLTEYPRMADQREETKEAFDSHEFEPSKKNNGRISLLESGEDFEVLDEDDIGDDPPPLEDTGGGKKKNTDGFSKKSSDTDSEFQGPVEEWLDVLGM